MTIIYIGNIVCYTFAVSGIILFVLGVAAEFRQYVLLLPKQKDGKKYFYLCVLHVSISIFVYLIIKNGQLFSAAYSAINVLIISILLLNFQYFVRRKTNSLLKELNTRQKSNIQKLD